MRRRPFVLAVLAAFLSLAGEGKAHRVNVFAFVDGDAIQVECGFSGSRNVKNGRLEITDRETGETIAEGTTDEAGRFRFRPSDAFLATGHGLNIRLFAGAGHQDDWKIAPEELQALSRSAPQNVPPIAADAATAPPGRDAAKAEPAAPAPGGSEAAAHSSVDTARLEAIIGEIVEAKLAPVKQALLRQQDASPGFRDIVGGIGWILGLLGVATYMKYRR